MIRRTLTALCLVVAATLHAADADTLLMSQGGVKVTLGDIDAIFQRLKNEQRAEVASDPKQVDKLVLGLLRDKQLAAQAVELKLDRDSKVQAQIALATTEVLSRERMNAFEQSLQVPNMETLAKEEYIAHKDKYAVPASVAVQHLLIEPKGRSDAEAKALAEKLRAEAVANPAGFELLVSKYSDDPTKASNLGQIRDATSAKVVPEFAAASARLKTIGEISPVVHTQFGYHVIKLLSTTPARQFTFAEAKDRIEAQLRENYVAEQRKTFLAKLDSETPTVNPQIMQVLHDRYASSTTPASVAPKKP